MIVARGEKPEQGRLPEAVVTENAARPYFSAIERRSLRRVWYIQVGSGDTEKTGTSINVFTLKQLTEQSDRAGQR